MRVVTIVLIALALVAPAAAQSTIVTPVTDGADVGDEPNTPSSGTFTFKPKNSPDGYPADSNGIAQARLGVAPVSVLEMRPIMGGVLPQVHDITANWLLTPFLGQDFMSPNGAQYRVVVGSWADYNADGYIQNDQWDSADPTKNPTINGRALAGATPDEWEGKENSEFTAGSAIVTYATGYSTHTRDNGGIRFSQVDGRNPDSLYRTDNNIDGWYTSLLFVGGSPFGSSTFDRQLLNTVVYETYIGQKSASATGRLWLAEAGTPIDVDVYKGFDPSVEALYISTAEQISDYDHEANETANNLVGTVDTAVNDTLNGLSPFVDPILSDANDTIAPIVDMLGGQEVPTLPPTSPMVGPTRGLVYPRAEYAAGPDGFGSNAHDYTSSWHPWIDIEPRHGAAAPTPMLIASANLGQNSFVADGAWHMTPGQFYPIIRHGLWWDKNADGFIRDTNGAAEEPSEGCEDMYNCGMTSQPNQFSAGHSEWRGECQPSGVDATYTPVGGRWGRTGVYVMGAEPPSAKDDDLTPSIRDIQQDGDVDRLVLTGPITTTSSCNAQNSPYQYFPSQKIIFPEGNADYAFTIETARACSTWLVDATPVTECTSDKDEIAPWAT